MKKSIFKSFQLKGTNTLSLLLLVFFIFNLQPAVLAAEQNHHEEHEEHALNLSEAELQEFSIQLAKAKPGLIHKTLNLSGEVIVAPQRLYHVVPTVSGVVRQVFKHLGDEVEAGELLAILSSRELADAKAQFVAMDSLMQLANANLTRERDLYRSNVTAKRKYLAARQAQMEASVKRKAAEQRLLSIGLNTKSINAILGNNDKDLNLYELRAPSNGIIIEKHAALGEVLRTDLRSFTVADLTQVWVNLTVYQKDLPLIRQGQPIIIRNQFQNTDKKASSPSTISWLSPVLDKTTRSATARVVINNTDGHWRPGLFVSGTASIASIEANIVVPLSALQTVEGETVVFIRHEDGEFEAQPVVTGRRDDQQVEILQGLEVGQNYISHNAFILKAQLQKGQFGDGHQH